MIHCTYPLLPCALLGRLDCIGISRATPLEGMGAGVGTGRRGESQMEQEGCTIFLPKGHFFFSLWLTHKDHLKGFLKYHSSIHSAKGPCEQRPGERSPSKQKGPTCLWRKSSFLKI